MYLQEYAKITDAIKEFFLDQGITQVTIQPEFYLKNVHLTLTQKRLSSEGICLMKCQSEGCKNSGCCPDDHNIEKSKKKSTDSLKSIKLDKTPSSLDITKPENAKNDDDKLSESDEKYVGICECGEKEQDCNCSKKSIEVSVEQNPPELEKK